MTHITTKDTILHTIRMLLLLLMMTSGAGTAWGGDITTVTELTAINGSNESFVIKNDIDASSLATIASFSGILEAAIDPTTHMPFRIKNLKKPLFTTLTGTVKNLVLENVAITSGDASGNTGAIACNVTGTSTNKAVIYNCGILSGSVNGTGNVGGLVGVLGQEGNTTSSNNNCYARVINCYSFADIESGSVKGGIVGKNCFASIYTNIRSMVMNCMFYGDIVTSENTTVYPIYGGSKISNESSSRLNNYNFFLYEAPFSLEKHITDYNCALAAEERFLVRFEFYRHLLNSTRELAAWYATNSPTQSSMLKWVLDKSIASYPILKVQDKYPSVVNYDENQVNKVTTLGASGTLTINIQMGSGGAQYGPPTNDQNVVQASITTSSVDKPITDKNPACYNFNYGKVQLPYYNDVGTGNYTYNRVVTGWKIVSMTGGTSGGYTETNYEAPNYNYADRDHYGKDIYSKDNNGNNIAGTSGRVFAQGAYFNVPTGVTAITIEPYWAKCAYLSDACYDRYGYNNTDNLTQVGGGKRYTNDNDCPLLSGSQKVYTNITDALGALSTASSVYDNALVLVGNYHKGDGTELVNDNTKPLTIMSIDINEDNEPDYCFIFKSAKNQNVSHIRYDFITVPGMAMAHKLTSSTDLAIPGNCCPQGWFEITTTGLIQFGQFEHSHPNKVLSPLILMGGVIEQFVANNTNEGATAPTRTKYMLLGDNVWFKLFNNGCHMDKFIAPPHRPISVTGGEYEKFYLSGYFRPEAKPTENDHAECYIDGGEFGEVAGAGQDQIDGNVTWQIDHANIVKFYGGGINAAKPITGNITTNIKNSHVDIFCGGPEFGNMQKTGSITIKWDTNKAGTTTANRSKTIDSDRTVTTIATDCTFDTFFGAGFGGTSIYREQFYNKFESLNYDEWNTKVNGTYKNGTRGQYTAGKGVAVNYEYEFFGGSRGNVHRLYLWYASFSKAQTNNVTSTLTRCTVDNNFYGGGSLGAVSGNAISTLTDCTILGSVFGAGYSVNVPTVEVRELRTNPGPFIPEPKYNTATGVYEKGGYPDNEVFTWEHATVDDGDAALDGLKIKTNESLEGLGAVTGNVTLTLNGSTDVTGNVYGGGESSDVKGSDKTITVNLQGSTVVHGNVFGGGNEGVVEGSTTVNIQN